MMHGQKNIKLRLFSVIKSSQLMFYRSVLTVCSYIYVKHTNTVDGQNVEFFNMKTGTYCSHLALQRLMLYFLFTPTVWHFE